MKKVTYSIDHNNNLWHIWKIIENNKGFNIYSIYTGEKKKECLERLKKMKNGKRRI